MKIKQIELNKTKSDFFNKQFCLYTPIKENSKLLIKSNSNRFLFSQRLSKQLKKSNLSSFIEENYPHKNSTPFQPKSSLKSKPPYTPSKLKSTTSLTNMLSNNQSKTISRSRSIRQVVNNGSLINKSLFCIKNSTNNKDIFDKYDFNEFATKATIDRMYKQEIARLKYNKQLVALSTQTPLNGIKPLQMIPKHKINLLYNTFHIHEVELKPFDSHYKTRNLFNYFN